MYFKNSGCNVFLCLSVAVVLCVWTLYFVDVCECGVDLVSLCGECVVLMVVVCVYGVLWCGCGGGECGRERWERERRE